MDRLRCLAGSTIEPGFHHWLNAHLRHFAFSLATWDLSPSRLGPYLAMDLCLWNFWHIERAGERRIGKHAIWIEIVACSFSRLVLTVRLEGSNC